MTRTFAMQMDARKRYCADGEQTVTVQQNVSVSTGGQAIVGNVTQNVPANSEAATSTSAWQLRMRGQPQCQLWRKMTSVHWFVQQPEIRRMTGVHKRNTDPMLSSLRCGAKTRSGSPCKSPAVGARSDVECMEVRLARARRTATKMHVRQDSIPARKLQSVGGSKR